MRPVRSVGAQVRPVRRSAPRSVASTSGASPLAPPVAATQSEPRRESSKPSGESASLEDSFKAALKQQAAERNARDHEGSDAARVQRSAGADSADAPGVAVSLVVDPPDATIYRNGAVDRSTPPTYTIKKGQVVVVMLVRSGFRSRVVRLDGSRRTVSVTLKKRTSGDPP